MPKFEMNIDFSAIEKDIQSFLNKNITYNFKYLNEIVQSINNKITDAVRQTIIDEIETYFKENKDLREYMKIEINDLVPKVLNEHFYKNAKKMFKEALDNNLKK